jgi:hypothetical protein
MSNNRRSPLKIIIVVLLILGAVYAVSVYTRNHETNESSRPALTEKPVMRGGDLK